MWYVSPNSQFSPASVSLHNPTYTSIQNYFFKESIFNVKKKKKKFVFLLTVPPWAPASLLSPWEQAAFISAQWKGSQTAFLFPQNVNLPPNSDADETFQYNKLNFSTHLRGLAAATCPAGLVIKQMSFDEKMRQELHGYRGLSHLERGWACPQPFPYIELNVFPCIQDKTTPSRPIMKNITWKVPTHQPLRYWQHLKPVWVIPALHPKPICAWSISTTHCVSQEQGSGHRGIPPVAHSPKQTSKFVGEL